MDKFELKEKLIDFLGRIEEMCGELNAPACADEETGRKRCSATGKLMTVYDELHEIMYDIY